MIVSVSGTRKFLPKRSVIIRPGDVVRTPADEWHWHGAAPDHFMTHLSITEGDAEWGAHVTDTEYAGDQ